jgi:hypothetical protein
MKRAAGECKALPKSVQCGKPRALSLDDTITHLTPYCYLLNGDGVLGEVYVENQTYEQREEVVVMLAWVVESITRNKQLYDTW